MPLHLRLRLSACKRHAESLVLYVFFVLWDPHDILHRKHARSEGSSVQNASIWSIFLTWWVRNCSKDHIVVCTWAQIIYRRGQNFLLPVRLSSLVMGVILMNVWLINMTAQQQLTPFYVCMRWGLITGLVTTTLRINYTMHNFPMLEIILLIDLHLQ